MFLSPGSRAKRRKAKSPTTQTLTSGTNAIYRTDTGATWLEIYILAAGGGGAGSTTPSTAVVGTVGNDSIFNGVHAAGGSPGTAAAGVNAICGGGAGGSGGAGTANFRRPGCPGESAIISTTSTPTTSGGPSAWGGGATALASIVAANGNAAAANSGGGGSGAMTSTTNFCCGGGGGGGELAFLIIANPALSYIYTVGTGGPGGIGGQTGGAGGSGVIIVIAHYD